MPPTGARIGGALDDMNAVMARLTEAGAASAGHAADVRIGVETLRSEVDDVSATLLATFNDLAVRLRDQINRAHDALVSADWSGHSRSAADAAETQLRADVATTLESAQTGVEALGSALRRQVETFYDEVTGQFTTVMTNIETAYGELSRGTRQFAENLAQADQTIRFGG